MRHRRFAIALLLSALLLSPTSFAQESAGDDEAIEEIIVTALKRGTGTTLLNTPLAVSAIGGNELEERGISSAFEAFALAPGVSVAEVGGQGGGLSIRGVAGALGDTPIGYYLDDLPFTRIGQNVAPDLNPYDLDRIEVLRGPQGTLFGLGSAGGTVRIITRRPDPTGFEAKATAAWSATGGGGDNYRLQGAVNVPILEDRIALRVVGSSVEQGGFIDRPLEDNDDFNEDDDASWRAKLLIEPVENFSAVASYWHSENTTHNRFANEDLERRAALFLTNPLTFGADFTQPTVSRGGEWAVSNNEFDLFGLVLEYEADSYRITSSTSYLEYESLQLYDDFVVGIFSLLFDVETFAQEINVASVQEGAFDWVLGGIYLENDMYSDSRFGLLFPGAQDPFFVPVGGTESSVEQWAVFGEVSYNFSESWALTLGGRYASDERGSVSNLDPSDTPSGKFDKFTGRANLAWRPTDDTLLYFNFAQAYRAGGFNTRLAIATAVANGVEGVLPAVEPDEVTTYEIGAKFGLLEGDLDLELTAYVLDWKNNQIFMQYVDRVVNPGVITAHNQNAASVDGKGVDVAVNYRGIEGLTLGLTANISDTEYASDVPGAGIEKGDAFFQAADLTLSALAGYRRPLARGLQLSVLGTVSHITEREDRALAGVFRSDKTTLVNARAGVEADKWSLFVTAENLFDEDGAVSQFVAFIPSGGEPIRPWPRTIGVEVNVTL